MSPRHRWTAKRVPTGAAAARPVMERDSSRAIAGRAGGGRLGQQHELDRDLDLEQRAGTGEGRDLVDLAQRGLGERGAVAQRAGRAEREHGQVEIARHALLELQLRFGRSGTGLLELRETLPDRRRVTEVEHRPVEPVALADAHHRHLVVVRPVALLAQFERRMRAQALDDRDDPVPPFPGLAVGQRPQERTEDVQSGGHGLGRGAPGQASDEMRFACGHGRSSRSGVRGTQRNPDVRGASLAVPGRLGPLPIRPVGRDP